MGVLAVAMVIASSTIGAGLGLGQFGVLAANQDVRDTTDAENLRR